MSKKGKKKRRKQKRKETIALASPEPANPNEMPMISMGDLPFASPVTALRRTAPHWFYDYNDGEKFPGGYGPTVLLIDDYWTMRARSKREFETNPYARGVIRRLITNIINTGLELEARPEEELLGRPLQGLAPWAEDIENRFSIWANNPKLCHVSEQMRFGALQAVAEREAYLAGDCVTILLRDRRTGLPRVKLVSGESVHTPMNVRGLRDKEIIDGVELDKNGRHLAYWIVQRDNTFKRMPCFGPRSGRRQAWMIYGIERRADEVRGKPLLSIVIQNLREIDRYRDAVLRKAVANGQIATFIKKEIHGGGSLTNNMGGALKKGTVTGLDNEGQERNFPITELIPGLFIQELNPGEEPVPYSNNGTDERFGDFEEAIVQGVAWSLEIPPEILRLSFSNNYSASQAAINEFKIMLNPARTNFAAHFCAPIYHEWLLSEAIAGRVDNAQEILAAWRDPQQYLELGAWVQSDWSGHIKPSTDILKYAKAFEIMRDNTWITNARITRELTGMKHSKVVRQLAVENAEIAKVRAILQPTVRPDDPNDVDDEQQTEQTPERPALAEVG